MSDRRVPRHAEHRPVELWRKGDRLMARCSCALQGTASDIEAHMTRINAGAECTARFVAEAMPVLEIMAATMIPPAPNMAFSAGGWALLHHQRRRLLRLDAATRSTITTLRMRRFLRIADEAYPAKFVNWGAFYAPAIRAAFAQLSERAHGAAAE